MVFVDPPERIEISDKSITLAEGKKSEKVVCTAEAYPEAHYEWIFNEKVRLMKKQNFSDAPNFIYLSI